MLDAVSGPRFESQAILQRQAHFQAHWASGSCWSWTLFEGAGRGTFWAPRPWKDRAATILPSFTLETTKPSPCCSIHARFLAILLKHKIAGAEWWHRQTVSHPLESIVRTDCSPIRVVNHPVFCGQRVSRLLPSIILPSFLPLLHQSAPRR